MTPFGHDPCCDLGVTPALTRRAMTPDPALMLHHRNLSAKGWDQTEGLLRGRCAQCMFLPPTASSHCPQHVPTAHSMCLLPTACMFSCAWHVCPHCIFPLHAMHVATVHGSPLHGLILKQPSCTTPTLARDNDVLITPCCRCSPHTCPPSPTGYTLQSSTPCTCPLMPCLDALSSMSCDALS